MTQHTPGPWAWKIDLRHRDIRLDAGSLVVMDFARWGMQGAQPRFRLPEYGDVLIEVADLVKEPSLLAWPHPDARLIAAAPDLLAACEALVNAVETERKAQDEYIQKQHTDEWEKGAAEAYEDACATTIICEDAARAAIAKAKGSQP